MSYCTFEPTETEHVYKCKACDFKTAPTKSPAERIYRECPKGKAWHVRVRKFAIALFRHSLDLFRRRTPWEIGTLFKICSTCRHYRPAKTTAEPIRLQTLLRIVPADGSCSKCGGCPLARGTRWRNKLAWRSESCPIGKWHASTLWGSLFRRLIGFITRKPRHEPTQESEAKR